MAIGPKTYETEIVQTYENVKGMKGHAREIFQAV